LPESLWNRCLRVLESELPEQQFNTWCAAPSGNRARRQLKLHGANRYVIEWLGPELAAKDQGTHSGFRRGCPPRRLVLDVGHAGRLPRRRWLQSTAATPRPRFRRPEPGGWHPRCWADRSFGFHIDSFVEGKSNQLAKAAAIQVAGNPGPSLQPVVHLWRPSGSAKTHLMHAVANRIKENNSEARLAYVHSERFVSDMVKSLQHNTINDFKTAYRSLDALMIDDIQFFAGKEAVRRRVSSTPSTRCWKPAAGDLDLRSVPEGSRWARRAVEVEVRLGFGRWRSSRRSSRLRGDSDEQGRDIAGRTCRRRFAFFIAKRISLQTFASSRVHCGEWWRPRILQGRPITLELVKEEALRDLLALQEKLVTVENIRRRSRNTTKLELLTCCRSVVAAPSPGHRRSRWRWRRN